MMSEQDEIPSHWINKAGISKRIGKSRITVDKLLSKIEKDPILSGRLNVQVIVQGKRNLYYYDPSDIDAIFAEINKDKKSRSRNVNSKSGNSSLSVAQHVSNDLQHQLELEQTRRISLEKEVARLEAHNKDLQDDVVFFKAQLTDQRSDTQKVTEPTPKPTPEAPKEEALPSEPTELGPYQDPYQPDSSIIEEQKRIYFEKTGKDIPPIRTQKDYDEFRKIVGSDYEIMAGLDQRYLNDGDRLSKAKEDTEPAPQPIPSKEVDTQPSEEPLQGEVTFVSKKSIWRRFWEW